MDNENAPRSEITLYQTEDGRTRVECRFEDETIWLTPVLLAELFQKNVRTVIEHLVIIYGEGELQRKATNRKFRTVRYEGQREVAAICKRYLQVRQEGEFTAVDSRRCAPSGGLDS